MREVLIIYLGSRGGGVLDTFEIAESLAECQPKKYSVLISENNPFRDKYGSLALDDVVVVRTHKLQTLDFIKRTVTGSAIRQITAEVKRLDPSGVLITMEHPWIVPIVRSIKKYLPATAIGYIRHNQKSFESGNSAFANWLLYRIDNYVIRRSDYIVTLSEHVREATLGEFNIPPDRVVSIGLGSHSSLCQNWKHKGFLPEGVLRLLFFGRLTAYKGLDILLSAYTSLFSAGLPVSLTIAGEGEMSNEELRALKELKVRLINRWLPDDELCRLLSETDAVVLPYVRASQSGPASIAVGLGIPVIATEVGGLKEQVVDGVTGIIVAHANPTALAEAIRKLLKDPHLLDKYSAGARSLASSRLSWRDKVEKIDSLFGGKSVLDC